MKVAAACKEIDGSIFMVMGGHHAPLAIKEESVLENSAFQAVDEPGKTTMYIIFKRI